MKPGGIYIYRIELRNGGWTHPESLRRMRFIAIKKKKNASWLIYDVKNGSLICVPEYWSKNEFEAII